MRGTPNIITGASARLMDSQPHVRLRQTNVRPVINGSLPRLAEWPGEQTNLRMNRPLRKQDNY